MTHDMEPTRRILDRVLVAALWLQLPIVGFVAWQMLTSMASLAGAAAIIAAVATALWASSINRRVVRLAIGLSVVGMVSLLLAASRGSTWQVDVHMCYFAVLAVLAAYCDWVVILVVAGGIAVHHLTLNFLAPALVFSGGSDLARVLLHAVVVVLEAAALMWMSSQVVRLFAAVTASLAAIEAAGAETATMREAQDVARARAAEDRRAALEHMAEQVELRAGASVAKIGERTVAMIATAQQMGEVADRSGEHARAAHDTAKLALGNAQSVASAAEQLSASIQEINGQVSHSAVVVNHAVEAGRNTSAAIEALNDRVRQIGTVAGLISGIAARTNLLALNATIEAARAGDAGKGFAVVANEVKQLATQTARSTDEIATHIREIGDATALAVATVDRIDATIREISEISGAIAAAMDGQGTATSEIARKVAETATAVNDMADKNAAVSGYAERAGEYANEVLTNTRALSELVAELKGTMVHIVRTSTEEVDRRRYTRVDVRLPCNVEFAGQPSQDAQITDLSVGGARLTGLVGATSGRTGTLRVAGLASPAGFTVTTQDANTVRVGCAPEAADSRALRDFMAGQSTVEAA